MFCIELSKIIPSTIVNKMFEFGSKDYLFYRNKISESSYTWWLSDETHQTRNKDNRTYIIKYAVAGKDSTMGRGDLSANPSPGSIDDYVYDQNPRIFYRPAMYIMKNSK